MPDVPRHIHLVTVGESILRNFGEQAQSRGHDDAWIARDDIEVGKRASPADPFFQRVLEFVRSDPSGASAELKAMEPFLKQGKVNEVYLYHTESGKGRFCASILKLYLEEKDVRVNLVPLKRLTVPERHDWTVLRDLFEDGLVDLLDKLVERISRLLKEPGVTLYLNATGGFKPEASMALLAASLMGPVHIYYVYEAFREYVELPTFPLTIQPRFREVMLWLDEKRRMQGFALRHEVEGKFGRELLQELEDRNLIYTDDEGRVRLRRWTSLLLKLGAADPGSTITPP